MNATRFSVVSSAILAATLAACGGATTETSAAAPGAPATPASGAETTPVIDPGDGGVYAPDLDPADFVTNVDNPFLPLPPGSVWVYEGIADGETERIEVVVTPDRRDVMGVSAVVVRDTVTIGDELVEDTFDWYAQDAEGNVWYLGEETAEYEDGEVVSTAGSWEAGVDGALPGIVMEAAPAVGDAYRQEYYVGEAEDLAEVVRGGVSETVPYGDFDDLLVIEEWNPLAPEAVEEKYYAAGIGMVLEVKTAGGDERVELLEFIPGS